MVSSDPARLDVDAIHAFLTACYWSTGIPRETVARALAHSLGFGLYAPDGSQVGFVRAVTDRATYAYLCDVSVPQWTNAYMDIVRPDIYLPAADTNAAAE